MKGIERMADVCALERRPPTDLPCSTYEMIGRSAEAQADAPALSFFLQVKHHARPQVWTYRQLFERITATANFFHHLGVRREGVVAFALPNLPETHFTIWGGQAAGVVQAINPLLEPEAIAQLLCAGEAEVLVTLAPFPGTDLWQKLQPVLAKVPSLRHLVLVDLADHVSGLKGVAVRLLQRHRAGLLRRDVPRGIAVHDFNRSLRTHPSNRLVSGRVIRSDDLSSYFCTGGTTGLPKIAMRTHANEVSNAWSASQYLGEGIGPSKNIFCGLPLFHVNAVLVTGLAPFSRGAHVVLGTPQGYRGDGVVSRFWELVEHHRINFFSGVPTLYASLLQQPMGGRSLASLEYGLCGAAPMPMELMRKFQEATGVKILEGYGLTEGTCVSSCNPPLGERRIGSIGLRVPLQRMKAVVLDESGAYVRDCGPGEVGVLTISGPNVFTGYKTPEHNKAIWIDMGDGVRWLNTGDLGRQDAEGYFYLTGRKKDLIIRGGHNIDPASIEEPLHRHPAVQYAAAVGRPDAHAGEVPVAYVQLKAGGDASEAELLTFARQQISERAALPKAVRVISAMPLTGIGKVFKVPLKLAETEDALKCALVAAGVESPDVHALDDPNSGLRLEVTLGDPGDAELARATLAGFPFRSRILEARRAVESAE